MENQKRTYENAGALKGLARVEFMTYRNKLEQDLVSLQCTAMVLNVKLQTVVRLGLPRHLVEKRAAYRKGDIDALLTADRTIPNLLLRELQEAHRQANIKQKTNSDRRYGRIGTLSSERGKLAKNAAKANRERPPTKDELARDPWHVLKLKRLS